MLSPGYYTVPAATVGADLVASLWPQGAIMWVGAVTVLCSVATPAYACIGLPIAPLYSMDGTRSGGLDSSDYYPARACPIGQPYSIIWPGVAGGGNTASMTVHVVAGP
jgi:hypothetical protein